MRDWEAWMQSTLQKQWDEQNDEAADDSEE